MSQGSGGSACPHIQIMDVSAYRASAFVTERLTLRLCLAGDAVMGLIDDVGVRFDHFVDLRVIIVADYYVYVPASAALSLDLDEEYPLEAILYDDDDPSLRMIGVVLRDDYLELADPRPHPDNRILWRTAVALRNLLHLITGVALDETHQCGGAWSSGTPTCRS